MIRAGYIVLVLLFATTMLTMFVLVSSVRNYTSRSLEHQDALRRATLLEAEDPKKAGALREEAARLEASLERMERKRDFAQRTLWFLVVPMMLLGFALGGATTLSVLRARQEAAPVMALVLEVRETGRTRQGCLQVVVDLEIEDATGSSSMANTKVYLCDKPPDVRDGMTAIPADRIRAGIRIPARYSPAFGGVVRLVAEDFE